MKKRHRFLFYVTGAVLGIIFLVIVAIIIHYSIAKKKAVGIAQEYLRKKYGVEMTFDNVSDSNIEPGGFYVQFMPPDTPGTVTVELWEDLAVRGDDYFLGYFSELMEEDLTEDAFDLWQGYAWVGVQYHGWKLKENAVAIALRQNALPLKELEKKLNDSDVGGVGYGITIISENKAAMDESAVRFYQMIKRIKQKGYHPGYLIYEYLGMDNQGHFIRVNDPEQVRSAKDILQMMENRSRSVNPKPESEKITKAVEEYLKKKYGQGVNICYTEHTWCLPDRYDIGYVLDKDPETVAQVKAGEYAAGVYPIDKSDDSYPVRRFETQMKRQILPEMQEIWGQACSVCVSVGKGDRLYQNWVPVVSHFKENASLKEQENVILKRESGYVVYVAGMKPRQEKWVRKKLRQTVRMIKEKGYNPSNIYYEQLSMEDGLTRVKWKKKKDNYEPSMPGYWL